MRQVATSASVAFRAGAAGPWQRHSFKNRRPVHSIALEDLPEISILYIQAHFGNPVRADPQIVQPLDLTISFNKDIQGWCIAESFDRAAAPENNSRHIPQV